MPPSDEFRPGLGPKKSAQAQRTDRKAVDRIRREAERAARRQRVDLEDLEIVPDEELAEADNVQLARLLYGASYRRLLALLRKRLDFLDDAFKQASFAFGVIKHMEGTGLKQLQLGKEAEDTELLAQLNKMRKEVAEISSIKAKALAAKQAEKDRATLREDIGRA